MPDSDLLTTPMCSALVRSLAAIFGSALLLIGCAAGPSVTNLASSPVTGTLVIANVTVVDVISGARLHSRNVVVQAGEIVSVDSADPHLRGALTIDGTGKYMVPGLWDMHAHHQLTGVESLDLFLANGVVGTRDMGSDADFIIPLRESIAQGARRGPAIVAAGPILDAAPPGWPFRRRVENAAQAREAVQSLKDAGVDFIKVHDNTPRDAFFAIAQESARLGLPFAGHVPGAISIEEAAASGMRSIEHLANSRVYLECSAGEAYSLSRCSPLFERLSSRDVWQTPTLAFYQVIPDMLAGVSPPHLEYASDGLVEFMRQNFQASNLGSDVMARLRALNQSNLVASRDLLASGSRFLAGCDGLVPGFCLHDELEWMTRAGFTPLQALQTATINPARYLGREATSGTIEAGKRADLVLLDADPLADIRNIRRVLAVVVNGRVMSKDEIDRILTRSKHEAGAVRR